MNTTNTTNVAATESPFPIRHYLFVALLVINSIITSTELCAQGKYEFASKRLLTQQDLDGYSQLELKIMRNEIFARYGYIFKTSDMKSHFGAQSWYRPSSADVMKMLTQVEKKNIELIKQYEKVAPDTPVPEPETETDGDSEADESNGSRYPFTSARVITASDLDGLSLHDLVIMRNEIFARYGYIFQTKELKAYFKLQPWYKPGASDVSARLTAVERKNVDFILKAEKATTDRGKLRYEGREVREIIPTFDGGLNPGFAGMAVVIFNDRETSWIIVPIDAGLAVPQGAKDRYEHIISDGGDGTEDLYELRQLMLESLAQSQLLESLSGSALLNGNGEIPTLSGGPGGEGDVCVAHRNGKMAKLDRYSSSIQDGKPMWGDCYLTIADMREYSSLVRLPEGEVSGRIDTFSIKKIIQTEEDSETDVVFENGRELRRTKTYRRAIWFTTDEGTHIFHSPTGHLAYTPPKGSLVKYVCLADESFAALVNEGTVKNWYLYTPASPMGTPLRIGSALEPRPMIAGCSSDIEEFGPFAQVHSGEVLQHVIDVKSGELYTFPNNTLRVKDGGTYTYRYLIPSVGSVSIWVCDGGGFQVYDTEEQELPRERFVQR
jgi:hypothetical protein